MTHSPPLVLTFAATDPTSGAGLQADLLTFSSLGCHGVSVVTGITAQDTHGVHSLRALDSAWVEQQARVLLDDVSVAAFKVGVLASVGNVGIVAKIAADYPDIPLVFDPVLASGRGDFLSDNEIMHAMCELLAPRATLLTPNSVEARSMVAGANEKPADLDLAVCARRLISTGARYVLITGTHESQPKVVNRLFSPDGLIRSDEWTRLPDNFHGSGCTLASAVAAFLSHGDDVPKAVVRAQEYTWSSLAQAFRCGGGQAIPNRFFKLQKS